MRKFFGLRSSENLREERLIHAANALVKDGCLNKYQLQRLSELWIDAGLAVER